MTDTKRGWGDCFVKAQAGAEQQVWLNINIIVKIVDLIEKKNEHTSFTIDHNCPGQSVLYGQCIVFSVLTKTSHYSLLPGR